jgi:hypothetical protein
VARLWNYVVSGTSRLRYISRLYYMQNLASFPALHREVVRMGETNASRRLVLALAAPAWDPLASLYLPARPRGSLATCPVAARQARQEEAPIPHAAD